MEQYIPKSAVLAEIRKYKNNAEAYLKYHHNRNDKSVYAFEQEKLAMCELLSSLDTLEVKEEPVSEDLEEAANFYANTHTEWFDADNNPHVSPAFKAGAKWQKEQLMTKAIEGNVLANGMGEPILHLWDKGKHLIDKKVKVVVIEED
jgi:hypothetical protein